MWTAEPAFYIIYKIEGSKISVRRVTDGREISRYASQFKLANTLVTDKQRGSSGENSNDNDNNYDGDQNQLSWRENLLRRTRPYQGTGANETETIHGRPGDTTVRRNRSQRNLHRVIRWTPPVPICSADFCSTVR